ncbi:MAG: GNAT family protein [Waddliaceae bacterium]
MTTYLPKKVLLKCDKEIVVRHLEPADADIYASFSDQISSETTHTLHYPGQFADVTFLKEKWKDAKKSAWQIELGGFDENKLVSHLSFYKPRPFHPYEKHTAEFGIRILNEYCSIGLGTQKLFIVENLAKEMGVKRIQAKVRVSNHIGISFYQKYGYEVEGVKKSAVLINGNYENEFYVSKILD